MKIPYGESDFRKIRTGNYLYIDKTACISLLEEQGCFNILLRPRRFGKSLFLSTLRHYYDIRGKDEFATLFSGLAAGEHPTPLHSTYQVLTFDFSGIATDDAESIRRNFTSRVENCLLAFLEQYHYGPEASEEIRSQESPQEKIDCIALLLYMGFVTITGNLLNRIRYGIPNYVIQKLYYDYFKPEIEQRAKISISDRAIENAVAELALYNNIKPLTEEIGRVLALFSNRDFMRMDEKHIKAVILTLLYQSEVYFIRSEAELNKHYPDILLLERSPFAVPNQFLFELKYCTTPPVAGQIRG